MDYVALKAEIAKPAYSGMSDAQIAAAINAATANVSAPVKAKDVVKYLSMQLDASNRSKWSVITLTSDGQLSTANDNNKPAARLMVEALSIFNDFDLTDPAVMQAVAGQLDLATAAGLITGPHGTAGTDAANILALGTVTVPLWQTFGERPLDLGDIELARAS